MKWFIENIKWFGPTVAMFILLGGTIVGIAADVIPRPARASDLEELVRTTQENFDKLTRTVQKVAEIQATATINSEIAIKQAEIRAIQRDYRQGEVLSRDSQITIDTLKDEIEDLRWQRDNPQ